MMGLGPILFGMRRRRLAARVAEGPLRRYLEARIPAVSEDCRRTPYLAVDMETTGLNIGKDQILSMGWVAMDGLCIRLESARQIRVRPTQAIPEASAVIHQITDDEAALGTGIRDALETLLQALTGRVLLAHHAAIELGFIDRASQAVFGHRCLIPAVDTLLLERQQLERRQETPGQGGLRLGALRQKYNLPRYRGHDALSDALAAAELFAAQVAHRTDDRPLPLRDVLYRPGSLW